MLIIRSFENQRAAEKKYNLTLNIEGLGALISKTVFKKPTINNYPRIATYLLPFQIGMLLH